MELFESIFTSLVASCIFGGTTKLIELLQANKSFDERLKDAFNRAVHKYFKDPLQQEKVMYYDADKYLLRLKQELSEESNVQNSEKFNGLYSYFKKEIYKDIHLLITCIWFYVRTGRKLMKQYKDEIIHDINTKYIALNDRISGLEKHLTQLIDFSMLPTFSLDENTARNDNSFMLPEHISYRDDIVKQLCTHLQRSQILLIYGTKLCGKSTLAKLVAVKLNAHHGTILIDCIDAKSIQHIKFSLQQKLKTDSSYYVILDNVSQNCLPELLEYLIRMLNNYRFIITTLNKYDAEQLAINDSVITQYEVPVLSESEVLEIVNSYHSNNNIELIVQLAASHHPILVQYICLYLRSYNWVCDENIIKKVIAGEHLKSHEGYISELIEKSLQDPETIHLLNRLLLFHSRFTENDVIEIANISPEISQPRLRFQQIKPLWLTTLDNYYQVIPVLKRIWKPDLLIQENNNCNKFLGDNILRKRKITDAETIQAIMYYQNAGMYDYAGEIYIKMIYSTHSLPENSLLKVLWIGVPLPNQMHAELRFIIRATQVLKFKDLDVEYADYLYKDIQNIVEQECTASHMAHIIYQLMSSICFVKNDIENGLRYFRISESLPNESTYDTNLQEQLNEYSKLNIWTLLMRIETWEQFNEWLTICQQIYSERHQLTMTEYTSCYFFVWRFVDKFNPHETIEERLKVIDQLYKIVKDYKIKELSIMIGFKEVDLFNSDKQFDRVYEKGGMYLQEYNNHPLADLVFNAAIGYAYYRDDRYADKSSRCLTYLNNAILPERVDVLPDVQLHVMEVRSYVLSSYNVYEALNAMQMACDYVKESRHRIEPYDYYFAKGELALAKWLAGERHGALEDISDCLEYVLNDLKNESLFSKTYLCKCGCLLVKFKHDIKNEPLPPELASPIPGMFTELGAQGLDDLYDIRRHFTTATIMFLLAVEFNDAALINKWMNKSIAICVEEKELKEEYGICLTMLPYLLKKEDIDKYLEIAELSYRADQLIPNHNTKDDDIGFITLKVLPLVILALDKIIVKHDHSLYQSIARSIIRFDICKNSEAVQRVSKILSTPIAEVTSYLLDGLDKNSHYEVYIITYLIMLLDDKSTKDCFTILFNLLKFAQPYCRKIYNSSLDWLYDNFVYDFWRWKFENKSGDFEDANKLSSEGFRLVNATENDKAKKCLCVVSYHIRGLSLTQEQEDWLYE